MIAMYIVSFVIFIISILHIKFPEETLYYSKFFRYKRKPEYRGSVIIGTRISGIIMLVLDIIVICIVLFTRW